MIDIMQSSRVLSALCKVLFYLMLLCGGALAFPGFRDQIPNGFLVANPCNQSADSVWKGVGHFNPAGSGRLNPFGNDFLKFKMKWTRDLCQIDSDGDGKTNGEELGDPRCNWKFGDANPTGVTISHPGIKDLMEEPQPNGLPSYRRLLPNEIDICPKSTSTGSTTSDGKTCVERMNEDPTVTKIDLALKPVTIEAEDDTAYYCQHFDMKETEAMEIVAYENMLHDDEVHHLLLYQCAKYATVGDVAEQGWTDGRPRRCEMTSPCSQIVGVWAFGIKGGRCLPAEVGVPYGDASVNPKLGMLGATSQFILEIHLTKAKGRAITKRGTGLSIWVQKQKRKYGSTTLLVGDMDIALPPQQPMVQVEVKVSGKCISEQLAGLDTYYIESVLFHMHKLGAYAKLVIKRNGKVLHNILDQKFAYIRPDMIVFDKPLEVKTSDDIEMKCGYDTRPTSRYTFYGIRTSDEMCFAIFSIYPRNVYDSLYTTAIRFGTAKMCREDPTGQSYHDSCRWNFPYPELSETTGNDLFSACVYQSDVGKPKEKPMTTEDWRSALGVDGSIGGNDGMEATTTQGKVDSDDAGLDLNRLTFPSPKCYKPCKEYLLEKHLVFNPCLMTNKFLSTADRDVWVEAGFTREYAQYARSQIGRCFDEIAAEFPNDHLRFGSGRGSRSQTKAVAITISDFKLISLTLCAAAAMLLRFTN